MKMKQTLSVALLLAACAILISLVYTDLPGMGVAHDAAVASSTIHVNGRLVRVTVADTPPLRERGLGGRSGLAEDEGMLFVFSEDGRHTFWMKDMRFAIDILWVSREGSIVDIQERVSPETYPATFAPKAEATYVVELPAGYVEEHDVRIGDIVRL